MPNQTPAYAAAIQFQIDGDLISIAPFGSGHINDTYLALFRRGSAQNAFVLQRINTAIFRHPAALMENIARVTSHLAAKLSSEPDGLRRVLTLIPTRDGRSWVEDADGGWWRMTRLIEHAHASETIESPLQAYRAAHAFGRFQQSLVDLPAPPLHETIPGFHNTPQRFSAFERALAADTANRAVDAREEIAFALARKPIAGVLLDAHLPERVTHNDTKLNNVLFDDATGESLCVIDLDTVMPGLSLYDFGDMVRTATSAATEDEQDFARVAMQLPMFEALLRGYLSAAGSFLTNAEKTLLGFAGKLITFEQGIRFLADHLAGDAYYKVHRPGQNLDRCRTQFKLIESMEQQEEAMDRLLSEVVRETTN
jgi:aminoglycoside phosphotransferase (APT) family kinase protein